MHKSILLLLLGLALLAVPTTARAQVVVMMRCSTDALDGVAALQRIEWARRCALTTNTAGPNSWFLVNGLREYREINTSRAYSGNLNDFNVNATYLSCRYTSTPLVTQSQDASGPTTGFWRWLGTTQRSRPIYPIFETSPFAGGGTQLLPLPTLPNDCNVYLRDPTTGSLSRWTGNFFVVAYCEPS